MRQYIIAGLFGIFIAGCTQNNNSNNEQEGVINLEAKSALISGSANFGLFNQSDNSKLLTFKITNNGTEPLLGPASLDNSTDFILSYQNCPASLPVKSSCSVKVTFNPKNKSGPYSANLMLDSVFVNLTASVNPPVVSPVVDYLIGTSPVASLNFGQITNKQSVVKSLSIKNSGSTAIIDTVVVPAGYVLSYDTCSGKSLAKGSSCSIKVSLSGSGQSGTISGNIIYSGKSLAITGEVLASSLSSDIVFMNGISETSSYSFGLLTGTASNQLILSIKNKGTGAAELSSASLLGTDFSVIYNQCVNLSLAPNASCQVRILFSATGKNPQIYSSVLSFGSKSFNLSAEVVNKKKIIFSSINSIGTVLAKIKNTEEVVLSGDMILSDKIVVLTSSSSVPAFSFIKWTGACSGQGAVCEIDMTQDRTTQVQYLKPISKVLATDGITNSQTLTHWFGDINLLKFEDYDTSSWTGNVTFLPRSSSPNPVSPGVTQPNEPIQPLIQFVNFETIAPQFCPEAYSVCQSNMIKWLEKISSVTLPDSGNLPIFYANNAKVGNNPIVNVISGAGPSRYIIDLFDDSSKFAFDGGGSPLTLNSSLLGQYGANNLDGLEIRRPIQNNNYILSYTSNNDSFTLKNSTNQVMGVFKKLDNVRLGRFASQYLNGSSGNQNFTRPVKVTIEEFPSNRTPGTHHFIVIEQLSQVTTKVNDGNYNNFINSPSFGFTSSAPQVLYDNSSFLRGQYSWINFWNPAFVGSPTAEAAQLNINVKAYNPDCSNSVSEMIVTRGKSGNNQITDNHCGIRNFQFNPDNTGNGGPVELALKLNFESSNVRKGMNLGVFSANPQRLSNKLKIYIPPTSQRINIPPVPERFWETPNQYSQLGTNLCNTTVLNYTYDNWISAGCSIAESSSTTVLTKPISSANYHKNYNGFGKIRIYDTLSNLSNWNLKCAYNGIDVDLTLSNSVTGQIEHYLNFNDRASSGYGKGYCHQLLSDASGVIIDPFYSVSVNLTDVLGSASPIDGVKSSLYQSMRIEYVDTSVSSETPESLLGVIP